MKRKDELLPWCLQISSTDENHTVCSHSPLRKPRAQVGITKCKWLCKILFEIRCLAFWRVYFSCGMRLPSHWWWRREPARYLHVRKTWAPTDCPEYLSFRLGFCWLFWRLKTNKQTHKTKKRRFTVKLSYRNDSAPKGLLTPAGSIMEVTWNSSEIAPLGAWCDRSWGFHLCEKCELKRLQRKLVGTAYFFLNPVWWKASFQGFCF